MKPSALDRLLTRKLRNGATIRSESEGRQYVISNHIPGRQLGTLRRTTPKVRGKAARRADKKARQLARKGTP